MRGHLVMVAVCGLAFHPGLFAASMTAGQLENVERVESITIPTPGEFFVAVGKASQPAWSQRLVLTPMPNTDSRPRIALLLGMLVADGYLAVEARDGQTVKNTGREIIAQARKLNVSQNVVGRSNSINDFADNNNWNALREELESTQNEVKLAMVEQNDRPLVTLVTLGTWIRALEIATSLLAEEYNEEAAEILRQPAIVEFLLAQTERLEEKEDPIMGKLNEVLTVALEAVREPALNHDQVVPLNAKLKELTREVSGIEVDNEN